MDVTLMAGVEFVKTGAGGDAAFGFNLLNNPTLSGFTQLSPGTPTLSLVSTVAGSIMMDGFANMEYAVQCSACGGGSSDSFPGPISFRVQAAGLTPGSFLETSSNGTTYFVVDVIGLNGNTGPYGTLTATPLTSTPEPTSLVLLGSGLGFIARKLRKK